MPPKSSNNAARRKRLSDLAEDVVSSPRRLAARAAKAYSPLSPSRRSKRRKKNKPKRYQSSPDEDEEQKLDDASPPQPARRSSGARAGRDPPPPSSSSSSSSTTSSRGKLPPLDSKSSDSQQSKDLLVQEDEVAGTQVNVPMREVGGGIVLDADEPAPDLQQIGYETSSISDNEDLLTPRPPCPRRQSLLSRRESSRRESSRRESSRRESEDDHSSTGSSGDNDYLMYSDAAGNIPWLDRFKVSHCWYAHDSWTPHQLSPTYLCHHSTILCIVLATAPSDILLERRR